MCVFLWYFATLTYIVSPFLSSTIPRHTGVLDFCGQLRYVQGVTRYVHACCPRVPDWIAGSFYTSIPVLGFVPCKSDLWLTTMLPTPTQFAYLLCLLSLVSFDITNNKQNSSVCVSVWDRKSSSLKGEEGCVVLLDLNTHGHIARGMLHWRGLMSPKQLLYWLWCSGNNCLQLSCVALLKGTYSMLQTCMRRKVHQLMQ